MRPSIETAKDLQRQLNLLETHVVWLDEIGFTMAHTDHERASSMPLVLCRLYLWLSQLVEMPVEKRGWYIMKAYEHDPVSESFRSDAIPYVFEPIIA